MRKILSVLLIAVMLITMGGSTCQVKASEKEYAYREVYDDSTGTVIRKAWFINGEEIDGNPEVIEEQSQIVIETTPDEDCAEYLASFNEPTVRVMVNPGVTVTFGSESEEASIQGLTCNNADVTVYAKGGSFNEDGSLPGSVYGVTCINSNVNFYGNIQYLCLGDEFKFGSEEHNEGTVVVNGSVYTVEYHTTSEYVQGDTVEYYRGFIGDASVSGPVGRVSVYAITHSNALGEDIKATIGEGGELPTFEIIDGVMSEETSAYINKIEPDVESFYYEYTPDGYGNWYATARYLSGMETGISKVITAEEMLAVLEKGTARISLNSWGNPDVDISDYDISELKVSGGKIIVNDIVTEDGNGLLQVDSYGRDLIDIVVNGDVDKCIIKFTRFNEKMNIEVNGTIKHGEVYKSSLQSDFPIYLGEFTSTDMPLFIDGVWNPDLFLSLGTTEYHPVDDTLLDEALDLEKDVNQGGEQISEMADMFVAEVESDKLNGLDKDSDFQTCVDEYKNANVLTGLDIELKKFDYNETTGEVSNQEVVTELEDGKDLSITVKVPEKDYHKDKEYIIVREHDNNGKKEMEVLVPEKHGDRITFKTNKFSSFILVEVEEEEETPVVPPVEDEEEEDTPVVPPVEDEEEEKTGLVHSAELKDKEDVANKIVLNDEEKAAIANGEKLEVTLTFNDAGKVAVTEEQKAIVEVIGNKKIGTFLEIDLLKKIGNSEENVPETNGKIAITFEISAELKNTDTNVIRKYSVVRYHNKDVDVLDAQYDEKTGTITFETDKFSTYALVYEDVAKVEVPDTGDTANMLMYMMLLCLGYGAFAVRNKKINL